MPERDLSKILGENILKRRRKLGLTQAQLAERLDIGSNALSSMEKGLISPKVSRLQDMAAALQCSVPALFRDPDADYDERALMIAELIRPLSPKAQEAVLRVVEEMVGVAGMG